MAIGMSVKVYLMKYCFCKLYKDIYMKHSYVCGMLRVLTFQCACMVCVLSTLLFLVSSMLIMTMCIEVILGMEDHNSLTATLRARSHWIWIQTSSVTK